jgi:hypothetical protein
MYVYIFESKALAQFMGSLWTQRSSLIAWYSLCRAHCFVRPIFRSDTARLVIWTSIGIARVKWVFSDEFDLRSLEVLATIDNPLNNADNNDDEEGDNAVI